MHLEFIFNINLIFMANCENINLNIKLSKYILLGL